MKTLLLFLLILSAILEIYAQQCEIWNNEPPACIPVLTSYKSKNNYIYINGTSTNTVNNTQHIYIWTSPQSNVTQSYLSAVARQQLAQVNNPLVPIPCRSQIIEYICLEVFRQCVKNERAVGNMTVPVSLPTQSCVNLCQETHTACDSFFVASNATNPIPICGTVADKFTQQPSPQNQTFWPGFSNPIPCTNGYDITVPIVVTKNDIDCGRLAFKADASPPCVETCVSPAFSPEEWESASLMVTILSVASCIFNGSVSILFLLRGMVSFRFPRNLYLFQAICSFICSLGVAMSARNYQLRTEDNLYPVWCEDVYTRRGFHGITAFQGFCVAFGSFAASVWWLALCFYVFLVVVIVPVNKARWLKHRIAKIYLVVGWIIPAILIIIPVSAHKMGYNGRFAWAMFEYQPKGDDWWEIGTLWIGITVVVALGTILSLASAAKLLYISSQFKKVDKKGNKVMKVPKEIYRLLFFVFVWLYIWLFIVGYKLYARDRDAEWKAAFSSYMTCYLKKQFFPSDQECVITSSPSVVLWFFALFNVSVQGIAFFIMLGCTKENYRFARALILGHTLRSKGSLNSKDSNRSIPKSSSQNATPQMSHVESKNNSAIFELTVSSEDPAPEANISAKEIM